MSYTYDQLKKMTVAELREIAAGIQSEAVQGYTQMNKEHLLVALCKALNIDTHVRHKVKAEAINKTTVKAQIKVLKAQRDEAIQTHDRARLKEIRKQLHQLRRSLRKAATASAG